MSGIVEGAGQGEGQDRVGLGGVHRQLGRSVEQLHHHQTGGAVGSLAGHHQQLVAEVGYRFGGVDHRSTSRALTMSWSVAWAAWCTASAKVRSIRRSATERRCRTAPVSGSSKQSSLPA